MTIPFFGATGNLFNRLGKYALLLKQVRTYQTAQLANMTDVNNGVVAQLNAESDVQAIMGSSYLGILQGTGSAAGSAAQALARATVNRMVYRDNPRLNQTLTQSNVVSSILEIIRQMKTQGATVLQMTVSATPSVGPSGGSFQGTGTGVVVAGVKRPQDGFTQENAFAETLTITCTSDSYSGTATAGNEGMVSTGVGQETSLFAFDWPLGSNSTAKFAVIDGNSDDGNGNLLVNSGFDTWAGAGNFLSNWALIAGTLNSTIFKETSAVYDGVAAVKLLGDGATLVRWRQPFGNGANGTGATLDTFAQYAFNVYARRDGVQAANGTLQVALTDAAGNVVLDANNSPNRTTIDLTGLTVNYQPYNFVINTPAILPATLYWDFQCTGTPLTSGRAVYLDKAGLGLTTQQYRSGPYLACFAGNVPFLAGDFALVTVSNSRGAGGTLDTFQTAWPRLISPEVMQFELQLPSSTNNNVSDALIG